MEDKAGGGMFVLRAMSIANALNGVQIDILGIAIGKLFILLSDEEVVGDDGAK